MADKTVRPSHLGWGLPKGIQGKDAPTLCSWRLCVLSEAGVKHKRTPPAWTAALAKNAGEPPALPCPDNGGRTFLSANLGNAGRGLLPNGLSEWKFDKKSRPHWSRLLAHRDRDLGSVVVADGADPDVAEASWVAVILQLKGLVGIGLVVGRRTSVVGFPSERPVVVGDDPIVEDGDERRADVVAFVIPFGRDEDHIVGLPLAGAAGRVPKGRPLTVKRGSLAIGVGGVLVGIEDLKLVVPREEETAVAASLAVANDFNRCGELQVELEILKGGWRLDGALAHFHVAVFQFPFTAGPFVHIGPVEENHGVTRRGRQIGEGGSGSHDLRARAVGIVHQPVLSSDFRRVFVARSRFFVMVGARRRRGHRDHGDCEKGFLHHGSFCEWRNDLASPIWNQVKIPGERP